MAKPKTDAYTTLAKVLHWVMALMIVGAVIFGWSLDEREGADLASALVIHSSVGLLILLLVMVRIGWRAGHPPPSLGVKTPRILRFAASLMHGSLYVLMVLVPLSGLFLAIAHETPVWLFGFMDLSGLATVFGSSGVGLRYWVHSNLMHTLVLFVLLHLVASLVHHFMLKDDLLKRMWVSRPRKTKTD